MCIHRTWSTHGGECPEYSQSCGNKVLNLHIHHRTRHTYESEVSFGDHRCFLRPRESHGIRVHAFDLTTTPEARQRWMTDAEGNVVRVCTFGLHTSTVLEIDLRLEVEVEDQNPFEFLLEPYATQYPFSYSEVDCDVLAPYLGSGNPSVSADWFRRQGAAPEAHTDIVQFLADLNTSVHTGISYVRREEEGIQSPEETIRLGSGSCRDMAMLLMCGIRELGLATRFVSGYLYDPPNEDGHVFNRAVGSMHAWIEVYVPGAGWKGFDPTNGILANGMFLPTAVSAIPSRIDPIQGAYYSQQSVASSLEVELTLEEPCHDSA